MKIEIRRQSLVDAMRLVGVVVPSNSPKPVLGCVRLEADGGKVTLQGTNLDTSIRYVAEQAIVSEPGVALIKAELFNAIVNAGVSDVLVVRSTENGVEIAEADAKYNVLGLDASAFPAFPKDDSEYDCVMPLEEFRAGVRRTEFAAAKSASRYAIQGVFLKQGMGQARLVATDGRRLACCQVKDEAEMEAKGIVPPKAMNVLSRVASDGQGQIKVKVRASQAWFECGPVFLATNLMAGVFPDYEQIIPKDCKVKLTLPTSMTLNAIRQAAVMRPEDDGGVTMSLSLNRLVFEARSGRTVYGASAVPVQYNGEPMEMKFQPEYVTDALKVVGAETFDLELQAPDRPALIRGPQDYVYVFMPIVGS